MKERTLKITLYYMRPCGSIKNSSAKDPEFIMMASENDNKPVLVPVKTVFSGLYKSEAIVIPYNTEIKIWVEDQKRMQRSLVYFGSGFEILIDESYPYKEIEQKIVFYRKTKTEVLQFKILK